MRRRKLWMIAGLVVAGCSGSTSRQTTTPDGAPDSSTTDRPDVGPADTRSDAGSGGASGNGATAGADGSFDGGAGGMGSGVGGNPGVGGASGVGGNSGVGGASGVGGNPDGGAGTSGGSGGSAGAIGTAGNGAGGDAGAGGSGGINGTGGSAGATGAGGGGSGTGGQAGNAGDEGGSDGGAGGMAGRDGGVGGMGGGSTPPPWFPDQSTNNSVELRGARFGTDCGKANPELRRKTVPVTGLGASFQLGDAYVLTEDGGGLLASIGIPITNLTSQLRCFGTGTLDPKNLTGDSILELASELRLIGSVATTGAAQYSPSCLGPSEAGVLYGIAITGYDDVYTATQSLVVTLDSGTLATRPGASVVPLSYAADGDGLHVAIKNQGTAAGSILSGRKSFYLHLDEQGLPVKFGTLTDNPVPNGNLAPGQDGSINDASATGLVGCGDRVRPFINFGIPSS